MYRLNQCQVVCYWINTSSYIIWWQWTQYEWNAQRTHAHDIIWQSGISTQESMFQRYYIPEGIWSIENAIGLIYQLN